MVIYQCRKICVARAGNLIGLVEERAQEAHVQLSLSISIPCTRVTHGFERDSTLEVQTTKPSTRWTVVLVIKCCLLRVTRLFAHIGEAEASGLHSKLLFVFVPCTLGSKLDLL